MSGRRTNRRIDGVGKMGDHSEDVIYTDPSIRGPLIYPKLAGDQQCWFALYAQVNHEREVAKRLEQKAVECFFPQTECWSKRLDRRKRISLPLFPGYIFIHTVLDNYTNINILKTPGALNILRNSEGALPIPDFQIDNLRTMLLAATPLNPHAYLREGDWVQVSRGPLTGCKGILLRQDTKKGRLVVSVDMISKSVSVQIDAEDVERIDRPALELCPPTNSLTESAAKRWRPAAPDVPADQSPSRRFPLIHSSARTGGLRHRYRRRTLPRARAR